eukprot:200448-Amphidinium_carterae.1
MKLTYCIFHIDVSAGPLPTSPSRSFLPSLSVHYRLILLTSPPVHCRVSALLSPRPFSEYARLCYHVRRDV